MTKIINSKKTIKRGACTIRFLKKANRWEVDAGLKLGHSKRFRRWFETKEKAVVYADKINLRLKIPPCRRIRNKFSLKKIKNMGRLRNIILVKLTL
jgi:hypothetical protein